MSSYRIPFVSLEGNSYEIRIYPSAEGYDGDGAVTLRGGADPMVTDEESDSDILSPVRGSTGYITIVTDDINLQGELMPTAADETRVTLVRHPREDEIDRSDKTAWEGYLCPQTFSQEWTSGPWELELPVQSRLSMAMDDYLSSGNSGIVSVGEFLARLCGDVYKHVLVPDNELARNGSFKWGEETLESPTALQCCFSERIFKEAIKLQDREDATDTEAGLWKPGTNSEVAASISSCLRWVFREQGDTLICDDPGYTGAQYLMYRAEELTKTAPVPSGYARQFNLEIEELGAGWPDTAIGGKDGKMDVLLPFGRVTLEGSDDVFNSSVIDVYNEDWLKVSGIPMVNGAPPSFNWPDTLPYKFQTDTSATFKSQKVLDSAEIESFQYFARSVTVAGKTYMAGNRVSLAGRPETASMLYANAYPHIVLGSGSSATSHGDYFGGGEICGFHVFYTRSKEYIHYRFTSIFLGTIQSTTRHPALVLRSTLGQFLPYCGRHRKRITMNISGQVHRGKTYRDIDCMKGFDTDGIFGLAVSVKMGDYYLYKDTWGDHSCSLTRVEAPFEILWTKDSDNAFSENVYLGMTEDMPMALDAPVTVTLYAPDISLRPTGRDLANDCKYLKIDNFRVAIKEEEQDSEYDFSEPFTEEPRTDIRFEETVGSNKLEEYELKTKFGGVDGPAALLCNNKRGTMRYFQTRMVGTFDGTNDGARYLCRRTWEWAKRQGRASRQVLTVPLRTFPWSLPEPVRIGSTHDGTPRTFFPAAKSINWRDDKTTLTLIEIKFD